MPKKYKILEGDKSSFEKKLSKLDSKGWKIETNMHFMSTLNHYRILLSKTIDSEPHPNNA